MNLLDRSEILHDALTSGKRLARAFGPFTQLAIFVLQTFYQFAQFADFGVSFRSERAAMFTLLASMSKSLFQFAFHFAGPPSNAIGHVRHACTLEMLGGGPQVLETFADFREHPLVVAFRTARSLAAPSLTITSLVATSLLATSLFHASLPLGSQFIEFSFDAHQVFFDGSAIFGRSVLLLQSLKLSVQVFHQLLLLGDCVVEIGARFARAIATPATFDFLHQFGCFHLQSLGFIHPALFGQFLGFTNHVLNAFAQFGLLGSEAVCGGVS